MTATLEPAWTGLVDDAAIFPPGDAALPGAVAAYLARGRLWSAPLVGAFVVTDVRLPEIDAELPVAVVVTGGAGALAGALRLAARSPTTLAGLEIALRDPDDLAGNARRVVAAVDAARADGALSADTPVHVELPSADPTASWLAAADVVAGSELRLKFRTGGLEADQYPAQPTLARWITAALDRETPFKCTAGLHHALPYADEEHGARHHGFLNVLVATRACLDGADLASMGHLLDETDAGYLLESVEGIGPEGLAGARRWFTSFGSCSVTEPLDDLIALGLLGPGTDDEGDA